MKNVRNVFTGRSCYDGSRAALFVFNPLCEDYMIPSSQISKATMELFIRELMDSVIQKSLDADKLLAEEINLYESLYSALVPDLMFKAVRFEHHLFRLLNGFWATLTVNAAQSGLGLAVKDYIIFGIVKEQRLVRIAQVLNNLDHPPTQERKKPDWDTELAYVLAGGGEEIPVQIVCDVYAEDTTNNKKYAFELKAPLPNSDQSKVSKEKLLKLYSMDPPQVDGAYYALPYNPYGSRENYRWSFPARWFNMQEDKVVLIGDEFWEKIGGLGTYQAFITAVNEIGPEYKERIYREYLGIEPPEHFARERLL